MEKTEAKLKDWCRKKKWYCKKLMTHTATGHGGAQEADFIVANNENVYMIECKERKKRFVFKDLTQLKKLSLLVAKTNKIIPVVLINIVSEKTLLKFSLTDFKEIMNSTKFANGKNKKSMTLKDIPDKFKYNWKNLNL